MSLELQLSTAHARTPKATVSTITTNGTFIVTCDVNGNAWSVNTRNSGLPVLLDMECAISVCCNSDDEDKTFYLLNSLGIVSLYYPHDKSRESEEKHTVEEVQIADPILSISAESTRGVFVSSVGTVHTFLSKDGTIEELVIDDCIISTQSGANFTLLLGQNGSVWVCDGTPLKNRSYNSSQHQLICFAGQTEPQRFVKVIEESNIASIACGNGHAVFLLDDGAVYSCGNGMLGELGQGGNALEVILPKKINSLPPVLSICCTTHGSFYITEDDLLFYSGQAGSVRSYDAHKIEGIYEPVLYVSSGAACTSDVWIIGEDDSIWKLNRGLVASKEKFGWQKSQGPICGKYQISGKSARK